MNLQNKIIFCQSMGVFNCEILQYFHLQGPFDGVLGFSQGASMVTLMCGLLQQEGEGTANYSMRSKHLSSYELFVRGIRNKGI